MSPLTPAAAGAQATTRRIAVLWVVAALGLAGPWLVLALAGPWLAPGGVRARPGARRGHMQSASGSARIRRLFILPTLVLTRVFTKRTCSRTP